MTNTEKEIEVRFKDIDVEAIKKRLIDFGFQDLGEDFLTESVFYDKDRKWIADRKSLTKFIRLRRTKKGITLTYKEHRQDIETAEAKEIEFQVSDTEKPKLLLEILGLEMYREQEKIRHSFKKGDVFVEFDTWPKVPTYVEIEASSLEQLKLTSEQLGLNWQNVVYENAGNLIEKYYGLEPSKMKYYTFNKIEYH